MATFVQDTVVTLKASPPPNLSYPPSARGTLVVAVHAGALKATNNPLTQVAQFDGTELVWAGALDENLLLPGSTTLTNARKRLGSKLMTGTAVWKVIKPGPLRPAGKQRPDTIYQGDRPWVVVAGPARFGVLAMPLNDAAGKRGAWHHFLQASDLVFLGSKDSKLEMNHLWSFPGHMSSIGEVATSARAGASAVIRRYYS